MNGASQSSDDKALLSASHPKTKIVRAMLYEISNDCSNKAPWTSI